MKESKSGPMWELSSLGRVGSAVWNQERRTNKAGRGLGAMQKQERNGSTGGDVSRLCRDGGVRPLWAFTRVGRGTHTGVERQPSNYIYIFITYTY